MWFSYEDRLPQRKFLWFDFSFDPHTSDFCLRRYFLEHSYHDGGLLNHILDDGKLVNHSETPNAGAGDGLLHSGVHDKIDDDDDSDSENGGC